GVCTVMLEKLNMDRSWYRVGLTKVFFRAGVLAELEEKRDQLIRDIVEKFQCVARGFVQRRMYRKQAYRADAARVVARNFQVYAAMQANPWWRLFVRMRPLLGATRQSNEVKKREEEIKRLQAEREAEEAHRARVDEERRKAEGEVQKIQQTLEAERALALDKEEIFRRLQDREAELTEKLASVLEELGRCEGEIDELLSAVKNAEGLAEQRRAEVEEKESILASLEGEREGLAGRVEELEAKLQEVERMKSLRSEEEEALQTEIRMLQSQVSLKERKMGDLEAKMLENDSRLDAELSSAKHDLQGSKKQVRDLLDENRSIRQQMSDLSSTCASFEDVIRRKDSDHAILKTDLKKFQDDRKRFEDEKSHLTTQHDSMQNRLRELQAEMEV
ncbi:hypothetical protein KC353_g21172, partial [Hortaea werneckii]